MPSVKYAISAYVADGTTTDYLITWDYLDEDHIAVYVDGTSNADPTASHTFSKLNDTTLRITDELGNAIASGAEIEIRRETPLTTRAITFADGSALLASDLNKNSDYLLYSMQEVLDTVDAAAQDGALAAQVATEDFRDEAEGFRNEAVAARNTTQGYLATVQSDATDADNHRIAAAASQNLAAANQAAAATSETNSANSATASANSAAAAATSAAASLASEQAAAASESAAAASETAAAASANSASIDALTAGNWAASTNLKYDQFDDRYLGAKATAPTVDNDGNALLTGALYWNSTSDTMYVWNGSGWDTFNSTTGIADGASSTAITIDSSGKVGIGTSVLGNHKSVIEGGGAATNGSTLKLSTGSNASGDIADLSFFGTFVSPTADLGPRRTADITSGFASGNWGNEYLSFGVGGGTDAYNVTTERMRIHGDGGVSIATSTKQPDDALKVGGTKAFTSIGNGQDNTGLRIYNGASSADYGAIRFFDGSTNTGTIHNFTTTWGGGNFVGNSAGAINIGSSNGVTLGHWNNPALVAHQSTRDVTIGRNLGANGSVSGSNLAGEFKVFGTGQGYESGRSTKVNGGLSVFSAYSGGGGSPHTYDIALGVYNYGRAMQFSGNWISSSGGPIYIRTLRDCCINWSSWQGLSQYAVSDRRAKNDIEEFNNPRNIIDQLQAYEFNYTNEDGTIGDYDEDEPDAALLPPTRQIGYMAQEIEDVVPHAVMYNKNFDTPNEHGWANAYSVDYEKIVPVLSEALKEVYAKLDEVQTRLDAAEAEIEVLKNG